MKKLIAIVLAVTLLATMSGVALADKPQDGGVYKGNGAPSGPHYNLNLIGMKDNANGKECEAGGHVIFVQLGSKNAVPKTTKILLQEGDFQVIDCDGTDGTATFQLPNPDPENSGTTEYSVFIRVLGKPGGNMMMETCATDPLTGEELCSDYVVVEVRTKGKKSFRNVSKELLYVYAWVCVDYDEDTSTCLEYEYMRVPLFADELEGYLWKYHNNGVKLAQLRFYPGVSTEVPDPVAP